MYKTFNFQCLFFLFLFLDAAFVLQKFTAYFIRLVTNMFFFKIRVDVQRNAVPL